MRPSVRYSAAPQSHHSYPSLASPQISSQSEQPPYHERDTPDNSSDNSLQRPSPPTGPYTDSNPHPSHPLATSTRCLLLPQPPIVLHTALCPMCVFQPPRSLSGLTHSNFWYAWSSCRSFCLLSVLMLIALLSNHFVSTSIGPSTHPLLEPASLL